MILVFWKPSLQDMYCFRLYYYNCIICIPIFLKYRLFQKQLTMVSYGWRFSLLSMFEFLLLDIVEAGFIIFSVITNILRVVSLNLFSQIFFVLHSPERWSNTVSYLIIDLWNQPILEPCFDLCLWQLKGIGQLHSLGCWQISLTWESKYYEPDNRYLTWNNTKDVPNQGKMLPSFQTSQLCIREYCPCFSSSSFMKSLIYIYFLGHSYVLPGLPKSPLKRDVKWKEEAGLRKKGCVGSGLGRKGLGGMARWGR